MEIPSVALAEGHSRQMAEDVLAWSQSPYAQLEEFMDVAVTSSAPLLASLVSALMGLADPRGPGALVIRGFPTDPQLPPTPRSLDELLETKRTFVSEACLLAAGACLGQVFSYREEDGGVSVRSILPRDFSSKASGSAYGTQRLRFHTEIAWCSVRPDFVLLYCVRPQPGSEAPTWICSASDALALLAEPTITELRSASFHIGVSELFRRQLNTDNYWSDPVPVVFGPDWSPQLRVNFDFMRAFRSTAAKSLAALEAAMDDTAVAATLEAGDLVIVDNRKTAHARMALPRTPAGAGRWLQQVYVSRDIWPVRYSLVPSSRYEVTGLRAMADFSRAENPPVEMAE